MRYLICLFLMVGFLFSPLRAGAAEKNVPGTMRDSTDNNLKQVIRDLRNRVKILEEKQQKSELQNLLQEAEKASTEKPKVEKKTKVFKGGQRALQAINPEISVTGDFLSHYVVDSPHYRGEERSGNNFRVLGIHFRSDLDPFSYTKIAVEVHPEGIELGEAYAVWSGQIPGFSFMAGKFRQQFGVVNRWHVHSLDQMFLPLAIQELFGEDGLNQTGFSVNWTVPHILPATQQFTLQMTNGQNDHLFSGQFYSTPAFLGHLKNYYDLSRDVYVELGLTGMFGRNRIADINFLTINDDSAPVHSTLVGGLDLTLFWEPLNRAHYRNFLWRSELFYLRKNLPRQNRLTALGGYSYVQGKLGERWELGLRGDWTQPYALLNDNENIYQVVPYFTWWQSHWVRMRLEFQRKSGTLFSKAQNRIWLQITWAAGPHKHERY